LIGNFNLNNDFDLIRDIAEVNPSIDFIFVGPYKTNNLGTTDSNVFSKVNALNKCTNIFFIGSRPAENLIFYL